jgi:putative spermidine/putrescine transport system permease protein
MKNKRTAWKYVLTLLPFLIVVLMFEAVPLATILINAFKPVDKAGFTISNFTYLFSKKTYQQALYNSIIISLVSAGVGIAVAFMGALAATSVRSKMRNFFMSILNMTSNFAGVPLALGYIIMLGNVGVMVLFGKQMNISALANFDLYSTTGLILVYIYFQIPLSTLLLVPAFAGIRKEWKESASLMKARPWQFWWYVGIPVLLPSIVGTFSVLFANALAAYEQRTL